MVDAANLERLGVPTVVLGLPQLLDTVGRATARSMSVSHLPFVPIPGGLHHALDYVPDESDFWRECVEAILPQVVAALTGEPHRVEERSI